MAKRFKLRLRDITPRGLYPRSVLMVVLPVILLLTAVTYIFYDSHWRHTSRKLSQTMASEIEFMVAGETRTVAVQLVDLIFHLVVGHRDRRTIKGIGFNYIGTGFKIGPMNIANDLRLSQRQ